MGFGCHKWTIPVWVGVVNDVIKFCLRKVTFFFEPREVEHKLNGLVSGSQKDDAFKWHL